MTMMDDSKQLYELVDDDLLARLETYADALLTPDPAGLARVRLSVVAEARVRAGRRGASGLARLSGGLFRRPALGLAGAMLAFLVLAGAALAGSGPGGPLYDARLWIETVTLPTDPAARTEAEFARLESRLGEATAAASSGDVSAVAAALDAYRSTVDATITVAGGDPTGEQRLERVLQQHRIVLESLVVKLRGRGNASAAIQRALDKSAQTIERIVMETPAGGPGGNPAAPGQSGPPGKGGPHSSPLGQTAPNSDPTPSPSDNPGRHPGDKPATLPKPSTP